VVWFVTIRSAHGIQRGETTVSVFELKLTLVTDLHVVRQLQLRCSYRCRLTKYRRVLLGGYRRDYLVSYLEAYA